MTISVNTNGNGKPRISFTLPTVAAICSIAGVLLWCGGFIMGYMAYTRSMTDLLAQTTSFTNRLTAVEGKVTETQVDVKYIGQSIAELKLAVVPRR